MNGDAPAPQEHAREKGHFGQLAETFRTLSHWEAGLSLTPCFSWVLRGHTEQNRFNGLPDAEETGETVPIATPSSVTQLKQGVNGRGVECRRKGCEVFASAISLAAVLSAAAPAAESRFPCPENEIARYTSHRVSEPIKIDGRLDEAAWQRAPQSPRFIDIISGQPALHDTRAAVLWDDRNLYVAFRVEEPLVHAKFTTNNSPIYFDNDVEVFIAGRDAYYEFEINAFNTCYEVFFVWEDAYERGGFAAAPEFQRSTMKPFNGVGFTRHPRGGRLGHFAWTFPGKKTAVFIDGTVNKDDDRDRGWTVELAFPWTGMEWLAKAEGRTLPPKEGDVWRMDFSRFNTYKAAPPARDSGGWVWSRHGIWDSHIPECFPYVRFTTNDVAALKVPSPK